MCMHLKKTMHTINKTHFANIHKKKKRRHILPIVSKWAWKLNCTPKKTNDLKAQL